MYSFTLEPTFHKDYLVVQPKEGFRFGVDSVILAHMVRSIDIITVLELGAGSGIVSLTLFSHGIGKRFFLVEKDSVMCEASYMTVAVNGLSHYFTTVCGDVEDVKRFDMKFDLVIFNPPFYLPKTARGDMAHIGNGKSFLKAAKSGVKESGLVAYIIDGRFRDLWEIWESEMGFYPVYVGEYISPGGKIRMVRIVTEEPSYFPYHEVCSINGYRVQSFYKDGGI